MYVRERAGRETESGFKLKYLRQISSMHRLDEAIQGEIILHLLNDILTNPGENSCCYNVKGRARGQ